jgi:hypothetical protein
VETTVRQTPYTLAIISNSAASRHLSAPACSTFRCRSDKLIFSSRTAGPGGQGGARGRVMQTIVEGVQRGCQYGLAGNRRSCTRLQNQRW